MNYLTMKETFKIPMQSEVSLYMKEKKGWPQKFCDWYAEKFWNHYQSNGWKVSGKAAMKDWRAAFNANWQNLRLQEDQTMLNRFLAREPNAPTVSRDIAYLNDCLNDYKVNYAKITDSQFFFVYDFLKERRMMKMTDKEKQDAKQLCKGDIMKGKAMAVKFIFTRMINNHEIFR